MRPDLLWHVMASRFSIVFCYVVLGLIIHILPHILDKCVVVASLSHSKLCCGVADTPQAWHAMEHYVLQCYTASYDIMSWNVMSCHVMSCHLVLCCVMVCYVIWCYVIFKRCFQPKTFFLSRSPRYKVWPHKSAWLFTLISNSTTKIQSYMIKYGL